MGTRQFFAQLGVFILVGMNVVAYFVFWPKGDRAVGVNAKGQEKFVQSLTVEKKTPSATPPSAPEPVPGPSEEKKTPSATPPDAPEPVTGPSTGKEAEKDVVRRLLDKINADGPLAAPFDIEKLPPIPVPLRPDSPRARPILLADPLVASPGEINKAGQAALTSTSALAAQIQESPWLLGTEIVGTQTKLIAQGPSATLMRFEILCDRVETKTPGSILLGVGKVTFHGAGFKGSCQRLTLSLDNLRITFEDQVEIATTNLRVDRDQQDRVVDERAPSGSLLRSDKIVWEPPQAAATKPNEARPATFNPPTPLSRTILDAPR